MSIKKEKICEVLNIYKERFGDSVGLNHEFPHSKDIAIHKHVRTMIDKIVALVAEDRMEKAFRWLGFIQGCMWTTGLYSIEELKNHNRPTR